MRTVATQLLDTIMAIGGCRIVAVSTSYMGVARYDIAADGTIGHAPAHEALFIEHLEEMIDCDGYVILRQFSDDFYFGVTRRGVMRLPVKNVYITSCNKGTLTHLASTAARRHLTLNSTRHGRVDDAAGIRFFSLAPAHTPIGG